MRDCVPLRPDLDGGGGPAPGSGGEVGTGGQRCRSTQAEACASSSQAGPEEETDSYGKDCCKALRFRTCCIALESRACKAGERMLVRTSEMQAGVVYSAVDVGP